MKPIELKGLQIILACLMQFGETNAGETNGTIVTNETPLSSTKITTLATTKETTQRVETSVSGTGKETSPSTNATSLATKNEDTKTTKQTITKEAAIANGTGTTQGTPVKTVSSCYTCDNCKDGSLEKKTNCSHPNNKFCGVRFSYK
jgi:hypothetical protein